jgi:elongation factor G
MAFKIAGSMVFKEAVRKAKPVLLEPIMSVEVVTPDDYMGDVIGDLNSRAGASAAWTSAATARCRATVPLSRCSGTSTDLRSRTQGRATYTMQFDSYHADPRRLCRKISSSGPRRSSARCPQVQRQRGEAHGQGEVQIGTKPH